MAVIESDICTAEQQDLTQPQLYANQVLGQVAFNRRVLELARDKAMPLLERLKFLCISSSNLDEFFEVRVAALIQKVEAGSVQTDADGMLPADLLREVSATVHSFVDEQYQVLNDELLPAMRGQGINFLPRAEWSKQQCEWVEQYFIDELLPVLSPIGLDPAHPFPRILNKSLNFIVRLKGHDAFGRDAGYAIVQAPRSLARIVRLPAEETGGGDNDFVFLSSIIHANVESLFPGMQVLGCYQFRVTRNSHLFVDEEEVDDLLRALEGQLPSRRYGDAVRLEVAHNCPEKLIQHLLRQFEMDESALYTINGPVNLSRMMAVPELVDRPDLKFPGFVAQLPLFDSVTSKVLPNAGATGKADMFAAIREQDILLHHPYQSFAPVIDLLLQAAVDPEVQAIKQTLYRTGADSPVVDALVAAARAGKEVTVVIELRARFDEADNIGLAHTLEEAGAHVVYGVVGHKTHAKMMLVVRRERKGLREYVHLGTGNYHPGNARIYSDYSFFSCEKALCKDIQKMFLQLTSLGKPSAMKRVLDAPFNLANALLAMIKREAEHARAGRQGRIIAKMNALVDPVVIRALYAASQDGVQIDLIVRGMCSLRPGIPGVSEGIRVRSNLGRFLEHSRVYYFSNDGDDELFLSSADWMERNLYNRVEACFPVRSEELKRRLLQDLELFLADNCQSWVLQPDNSYRRNQPMKDETALSAQAQLLETFTKV